MDAKTEQMIVTVGAGIIKKVLMLQAAGLVSHGLISSNNTEVFVSLGMAAVGAIWSFWQDFGKAIVLSQLEVLKAKSLAQAEKMRQAGVTPVTVNQIAMKTTMSASEVTAVAATLPAEVKVNIAPAVVKILLVAFALSAFLPVPSVQAQTFPKPKPLTGNLGNDLGITRPAATGAPGSIDAAVSDFNAGVQKIEKALVDKGIADLNSAITDATNHSDNISLPCWQANLKLLQSLPSQWENPPPSPIGIALGIQIQRDLLNAITGNDATSLKVACAALWGDQLKIVANLGALIGVRIASGGLL
jgi:hypothetical protein